MTYLHALPVAFVIVCVLTLFAPAIADVAEHVADRLIGALWPDPKFGRIHD